MRSTAPRGLRTLNEGAVLQVLFDDGPLTRPEIEDRTGLSKPATARLLLRVEEAGIVRRAGAKPSRSGPPGVLWEINRTARLVAGIEVGADRFRVIVNDLSGTPVGQAEVAHQVESAADIGPAVHSALAAVLNGSPFAVSDVGDVTLALAGVIDPGPGILTQAAQLPAWVDVDVIAEVSRSCPNTRVFTGNDVGLAAIAEYQLGAARAARSVALLWIGSGTRMAYMQDGELAVGRHGSAGEIDGVAVPAFGGRRGPHGSTSVPGGGLLLRHLLSPPALAAIDGDVSAVAERLAVASSIVVGVLDPEMILIAGEVAEQYGTDLAAATREALRFMPNDLPEVVVAELGTEAIVQGAAWISLRSARARVIELGSLTQKGNS